MGRRRGQEASAYNQGSYVWLLLCGSAHHAAASLVDPWGFLGNEMSTTGVQGKSGPCLYAHVGALPGSSPSNRNLTVFRTFLPAFFVVIFSKAVAELYAAPEQPGTQQGTTQRQSWLNNPLCTTVIIPDSDFEACPYSHQLRHV